MPYGKSPNKMESNKQEKYNLMHDNPVAKHASGSWMSKHSNSALYMGHSPLEKHEAGHEEPTAIQKFRNFTEPDLPSNYSGNRSNQMFDYDNDGDTVFNDSNEDGTMLSRGVSQAVDYLKKNFPMESGPTRPIFKDGKLNFDPSLMDNVGTGMGKK